MVDARRLARTALVGLLVIACSGEPASPSPSATSSVPSTAPTVSASPVETGAAPTDPGASDPVATDPIPTTEPTAPGPTESAEPSPTGSPDPDPSTSPDPTTTPRPTIQPVPGVEALTGTDGRFTVLILGTDYRPKAPGDRIDTIMVVTMNPKTGRVAAVSLPRDTVDVPVGENRIFDRKINELFHARRASQGSDEGGLQATKRAFEYAFGIEIDRYAFIGFNGVIGLVDAVGGIDVTLEQPLNDPTVRLRPGKRGLKLAAGTHHLNGVRALAFARSRKADSDYHRAHRQQQVIAGAIAAIRDAGPGILPELLPLVSRYIKTDLDLADAPMLYALLSQADLSRPQGAVLGPSKYAGNGAVRYTTVLKIDVVRELFSRWFAPVLP